MTKVAVVGGGIMGSGIAELAALSKHNVTLYDITNEALEQSLTKISRDFERLVTRDVLTSEDAVEARARISPQENLQRAVNDSEVVVEAVPENFELKREVWADIAPVAPSTAILGTNTSQISITRLGDGLGDAAERFIGTHFFNPPVRMRLVELVRGRLTSDDTVRSATAFAMSLDREVVVCAKDTPGFITTRAYAALRMECLRMVEEGIGSISDIDKALKLAFNFPMGPFELADFNGLDTVLSAMEALLTHFGDRFEPGERLRGLVAEGRLGRKTGSGFYEYE